MNFIQTFKSVQTLYFFLTSIEVILIFILLSLVPQSWYEVHLVAFNENGESRESVRNIITFSGDNPNAETVEGIKFFILFTYIFHVYVQCF